MRLQFFLMLLLLLPPLFPLRAATTPREGIRFLQHGWDALLPGRRAATVALLVGVVIPLVMLEALTDDMAFTGAGAGGPAACPFPSPLHMSGGRSGGSRS